MAVEKPSVSTKEISAEWDGNNGYLASNSGGASVFMGKDRAGRSGIGPMEVLLASLSGCTMMDVIDILKKKKQIPDKFKTIVRGIQRNDEYPHYFFEYQIEYVLWGDNLIRKDVEQAIKLSEEKYCSVGGTLSKSGPIHSTCQILPSEKVT